MTGDSSIACTPGIAPVLEQAIPAYAAWVAASFMAALARRPDAAPALERQMQFLRRYR
jgi:hypothetical protein